ncbi:MAG: hypothetical protein U0835_21115 [Isosphaeraceae bacterium]
MTGRARGFCMAAGLAVFMTSANSVRADGPGVEPKAAFARLKTLAGEWKADVKASDHPEAGKHAPPSRVVYKVTSNGSVVMETLFPGTSHEMTTMYHLDGGELRLTHYCAAGNQPRLRLDRKASTADDLVFVFEGGTNLDPTKDMHMHSGRIHFREGGRVESEWDGYQGGKHVGTNTFVLTKP